MSVERIANIFMQPHPGHGQRFILQSPGDMVSHLTMGQIIKGRVLRHLESGRYTVQISGEEKVVDSSVPLKTGELLYGRVVGLGEHVELERVHVPQAMPSSLLDAPALIASDVFPRVTAEQVVQIFTEYGASLSEKDASVLNQVLRASPSIEPTIYAGLLLAKLGLPFTPERLEALTRTFTADPRQPLFNERMAIYLSIQPDDSAQPVTNAKNNSDNDGDFARLLADIADSSARDTTTASEGDDTEHEGSRDTNKEPGLGYELLNLQVEGAMGHRVATVPLVIDGELIEVNIGLIDQREARQDQTATSHRRLVFTLNTEELGTVAVDGTLTGEHIQLRFHVEHADALDALQEHTAMLKQALQQGGFAVDAIRHEVATRREMPSVAWLAASSVIQNDCLDKWI